MINVCEGAENWIGSDILSVAPGQRLTVVLLPPCEKRELMCCSVYVELTQLACERPPNRPCNLALRCTGWDCFSASRAADPVVAYTRSITEERGAITARGMTVDGVELASGAE